VQDQGVISKEELIGLISRKKGQLEKVLDDCDLLKREIFKLEDTLSNLGENLNNPMACMNPIAFAQKKCEECGFYGRCSYVGRGDYGRFKL